MTKKIIIIGIIIFIIGGMVRGATALFSEKKGATDYANNEVVVATGDVVQSIFLMGKTQYANTQKLTFPQGGKVTSVLKKVGDLVKKGDILATIDSYEVDNELSQARSALDQEVRGLNKLLNGAQKELNLKKAERDYLLLKEKYKTSDKELGFSLKEINMDVISKEETFKDAKRKYDELQQKYVVKKSTLALLSGDKSIFSEKTLIQSTLNDIKAYVESTQTSLDSLDSVMHYTDKFGSQKPDYLPYIGGKNTNLKNFTETYFWKVSNIGSEVKTWYQNFSSTNKSEDIIKKEFISMYKKIQELGTNLSLLSDYTKQMFDADIAADGYTRTKVSIPNGYSLQQSASTAIDNLLNSQTFESLGEKTDKEYQKLESDLIRSKQDLEKASFEYEKAKFHTTYDSLSKTSERAILQLEVDAAKLALENIQEGSDDELLNKKLSVQQKQKELETILKKYDNYVLKANFDGIITKMNIQIGDTIGNTTTAQSDEKYIYIENPDLLEINLDIDQTEIVKLKLGMPAEITLDALPDRVFSGIFTEINTIPSEGGDSGSTTYKAKIGFQKGSGDVVLGAMTANIKVVLDEKKDVITVPNVAISEQEGVTTVLKKVGRDFVPIAVEAGLIDDTNTEVLSGLKIGDTIMGVYITEDSIANAGITDTPQPGMMY